MAVWIWVLIAVAVVVCTAAAIWTVVSRRRTQRLQDRFGTGICPDRKGGRQ